MLSSISASQTSNALGWMMAERHDPKAASRSLSLQRLRRNSEVLRGLFRVTPNQAFEITTTATGNQAEVLHTFYELEDGSSMAFFEAPKQAFNFKAQHDFDLHIALEVSAKILRVMFEKGQRLGIENRGITDHGFIGSIYFKDPNGYVVELAAKVAQPPTTDLTAVTEATAATPNDRRAQWQSSTKPH